MMRSMYSGVSGLRIHQTKMDVIGNNIANVNTVGFKSSRVTFAEVFSQTVQGASGANENLGGTNPMQIGLGSTVASIDVNMTEGAAQRTDNPLDLKIEGEGFFVVSDATGNKFTRAGAFKIDEAGNLVNSDGLNVMGWTTNPDTGEIVKSKVENLQILSMDNMYIEPNKTESITLSGNIDTNDSQLAVGEGVPFSTTIYDSLGYKYTVNFLVTENAAANSYDFAVTSVTDETGTAIAGAAMSTVTLQFDTDGQCIYDETTGTPAFEISGFPTTMSSFAEPLTVNPAALTMYADDGNTTVEGTSGDKNGLGAGNEAGAISGYEVGSDGKIIGLYSNGETKVLGQIAIATFANPTGLQKLGNNLFVTTSNSGEFDGIGTDVTSAGGSFNSGVLEMSNVDLSTEFTEMITTQRGFQANSRIITASDEMLQELVNLKR